MDKQKQRKMLNPLGSPQLDSAEVNSIETSSISLWQRSLQIAQRKLSEKRLPPLEIHDIPTQSASEIIQLTIRDLQTIVHTIQHNDNAVAVGWLQEILLVFEKYTTFVDAVVPLLLLYLIFLEEPAIECDPGVIALAWVAVRGILQVALNHFEVAKKLETTIAAILDKITLYQFYDNIYRDILALNMLSLVTPSSAATMHTPQQILASSLPELYAAILIFSVKARQYFNPSFTRIRKSGSIWRTSAVEFQPFIDEIFEKERRVRECADMAKMEISMKGPARLQHLLSNIESKKVQRLLRMLSPLEAWKRHQDVLPSRVDGTGTWLLEHEHFRLWCDPTNSPGDRILCCFGGVGTGKTVLSSIVIEHLLHEFPERDKVGIACLYGDYRDQGSQTLNNILGSFLKQLLTAASHVPDTITSILESVQKQEKRADNSNVLQLLRLTLPLFDSIFVCIDAVDELEPLTRNSLLKVIRSEFSTARIFLTGRPHVRSEIDKCLEMERRNDIEIMADQGDIKKCLLHHLALDTHPDAMNEELENEILSTILEQSQGTFLFPALHIRMLLQQRTIAKRRKALKKLSLSQNNVIACMIDRVTNSQSCSSELGMQLLMWLHLAYRSLKLDEVRHALAVQQGDLDLDKDNIPSAETLTECCLSLVVIDEKSTVRFVHHLLDEYLKQHSKVYFPNGHSTAAETSLTYLNFMELASPCPTVPELEQKKSDFAFLDYAACHWGHHIRQQSNDAAAELAGKLLRPNNRQPHSALGALYMSLPYPDTAECEPSLETFMGIHAAAYFGLETDMATLGNEYAGWDSKDGHGRTPLSYAAMGGHVALVRLLVDRENVDVDSKDDDSRTPLSWAATSGHEVIVRLLVERGDVRADSKDNKGRTALSWAAQYGREAVVQLLVNCDDVNVDSKDNNGRTPLSWAAQTGCEAIVRLLVDCEDVDGDSEDKNGRTPLSWAAEYGREAIVQLLVDRDNVNADSKDDNGQTPLSWAAQAGREATVRLLVDRKGVDGDSEDKNGQTPLSWAAQYGREAIVQLLVNRDDVNANSKDNSGQTPLSWAAAFGGEAIVQLLVNRNDVDADSRDIYGRTPLSLAAEYGQEAIVQLLVDRDDVNANSKDNCDWTPLSWAAQYGREAIVQLLVNHDDVNADSKDNNGRTPLSLAAEYGWEAIVQLLVNRDDVNADSKDNNGRTPLSWAAEQGHEATVRLLVDRNDVDINSKDNQGCTPLSLASDGGGLLSKLFGDLPGSGKESVIQLLKERGGSF